MKIRFGPFIIDTDTRRLLRGDAEIHLSPKAFDLLWTLMQRRPRVVDKAELHRCIWPDTHVVDAGLNVLIAEIRRAIGDGAEKQEFIRTVHGVGYAFSGPADEVQEAPALQAPLCWLVWRGRAFPLLPGDNLIGRDPRCSIRLDAPGVSRRHAMICIDGPGRRAALRDLGSTNGTFVQRSRVRTELSLADRDRITVGTVHLTVRLWASDASPVTKRIRKNPFRRSPTGS